MKIGILGAPGSGKSALAYELSEKLGGFYIIDGYIDDLRDTTGLEYGSFGNHLDDLQVVFKRRECELESAQHFASTITAGTVLDSVAHCFARSEDNARNLREVALTQERLRTIAESFGLLYTDTWDYDYAFYLPYKGDDPISRLIDATLLELIRTYSPFVLSFKTEIKDDQKATTAAITITILEEEQLSASNGRGVQSSSEAGEDDGDSPEPVPDVPEQGRNSDDA